MNNSGAPMRQSLVHDQWIESMKRVAATSANPACQELATFAADILMLCGDSPGLTTYLNSRALKAMEAES